MPTPSDHPWFRAHPVNHEHIVRHWRQATRKEIERGMRWYADAHILATTIANGDAHLGAGMLAIYSPQQGWTGNILNAARVLRDRHGIGGPGSGVLASASQKQAANRLLSGEPYTDIVTGPKIRNFAHLIEHGGDADPNNPCVVIDRHALSVACGHTLRSDEYDSAPLRGFKRRDGSISSLHYDYVVDQYCHASELVSRLVTTRVAPHQVQAVTWLVHQRLNQQAELELSPNRLAKGRNRARSKSEKAWQEFRTKHFPGLLTYPSTGYQPAA